MKLLMVTHDKWVPVTKEWGVLRLQMGEGLQYGS